MKRIEAPELRDRSFDIIVIGGGITGVAVAHEAALLGRSVALLEMNDFGSATSAATSKLIHGGLRYLKNGELSLVRESLRERRILGDIAPNLVEPLRFLIPRYSRRFRKNLPLRLGMWLYDQLSYDKSKVVEPKNRLDRRAIFSAAQTLIHAPTLDPTSLQYAVSYFDYANVNPDRMTLAFLKTACDHGAVVANYSKVESLVFNGNRISGVQVTDRLSKTSYEIRGQWVVNCAGPWVDKVLSTSKSQANSLVRSEGVHLITSKFRFSDAVVLETGLGDHLMFLPWRGLTIIGPTDKPYAGDPNDYAPTAASIQELIDKVNSLLPAERMGSRFERQDILFHYGGLRPLVGLDQQQDSYSASRRYEITDHANHGMPGLISVEGGKYTTSRGLAAQVLKLLSRQSGWPASGRDSSRYVLHPCRVGSYQAFVDELIGRYRSRFKLQTVYYYARNYGVEATQILDWAIENPDGREILTQDGEIMAEVDYVLQHELVYTLDDLLFRRTGIGWMGKPTDDILKKITQRLGQRLNWSMVDQQKAIDDCIGRRYTLA